MTDPSADDDQGAGAPAPAPETAHEAEPKVAPKTESGPTEEPAPEVQPESEPSDPLRPPFLDELPDAPELEPLIAAFAAGNYARVRLLARSLDSSSTPLEVRDAARELVRRTEPDRLVVIMFVLAFALFSFIAAWSILGHDR